MAAVPLELAAGVERTGRAGRSVLEFGWYRSRPSCGVSADGVTAGSGGPVPIIAQAPGRAETVCGVTPSRRAIRAVRRRRIGATASRVLPARTPRPRVRATTERDADQSRGALVQLHLTSPPPVLEPGDHQCASDRSGVGWGVSLLVQRGRLTWPPYALLSSLATLAGCLALVGPVILFRSVEIEGSLGELGWLTAGVSDLALRHRGRRSRGNGRPSTGRRLSPTGPWA